VVFVSLDGGTRFTAGWQFPSEQDVLALLPAPSRPDVVYGAGDRVQDGRLLLTRSEDGGRTFLTVTGEVPDGIPLQLLGVDPGNPEIVFVALRAVDGTDGIWRSSDGGRSWKRTLALPPSELLGGFAFGAAAIYAAGRAQLTDASMPPGHLYVSRDGGVTWEPGIPSGRDGPRFRCLAVRGDRLYACAGGAVNDDAFLLGSSADGGQTWAPVMTTAALAGPEPCLLAACTATSEWLCDTYGLCGGDAGVTPGGGSGGCHCTAGGPRRSGGGALWLLVLGLAGWRWRRSLSRQQSTTKLRELCS
jgi:photosystem II stability/assembly factor-like uncharacterized protein